MQHQQILTEICFDNDNIYLPFFTDLRPYINYELILDIKHRLLQQYTLGKFENSKEWIYYISVKFAIDV